MTERHHRNPQAERPEGAAEQQGAIVRASLAAGAVVGEVAGGAAVGAGQIYRWRRELGAGAGNWALSGTALRGCRSRRRRWPIAAPAVADAAAEEPGFAAEPVIAVEFGGKVRVRIAGSVLAGSVLAGSVLAGSVLAGSVSAGLAAAVVTALSRRCSRFDPAFGCGWRLGTAIGGAA